MDKFHGCCSEFAVLTSGMWLTCYEFHVQIRKQIQRSQDFFLRKSYLFLLFHRTLGIPSLLLFRFYTVTLQQNELGKPPSWGLGPLLQHGCAARPSFHFPNPARETPGWEGETLANGKVSSRALMSLVESGN